jgi:hypothetical protein
MQPRQHPHPLPARYPTLVLFVSGAEGIAAARALIESPTDVADLAIPLRQDVVVYYSVSGWSGGRLGWAAVLCLVSLCLRIHCQRPPPA